MPVQLGYGSVGNGPIRAPLTREDEVDDMSYILKSLVFLVGGLARTQVGKPKVSANPGRSALTRAALAATSPSAAPKETEERKSRLSHPGSSERRHSACLSLMGWRAEDPAPAAITAPVERPWPTTGLVIG
jgi:hypothetical protein